MGGRTPDSGVAGHFPHRRDLRRGLRTIRTPVCSIGGSHAVPCTMSPNVLPAGLEPALPPSESGVLSPRLWKLASVREESNLYAEATGLRPAGLTTCPTHGWGDRRELNPLRPGSRPGSSPIGSVTTSAPRRNRTSIPWVWARCSAIELAEHAYPGGDSNSHPLGS